MYTSNILHITSVYASSSLENPTTNSRRLQMHVLALMIPPPISSTYRLSVKGRQQDSQPENRNSRRKSIFLQDAPSTISFWFLFSSFTSDSSQFTSMAAEGKASLFKTIPWQLAFDLFSLALPGTRLNLIAWLQNSNIVPLHYAKAQGSLQVRLWATLPNVQKPPSWVSYAQGSVSIFILYTGMQVLCLSIDSRQAPFIGPLADFYV